MNAAEKIKKSWWIIFSFIIFFNGFGFIYIGLNHKNKNWLIEGIIYEIPWFVYLVYFPLFGSPQIFNPTWVMIFLSFLLMLISIIRSFWVAIKLIDVYENNEKYTIKTTELNNPNNLSGNPTISSSMGCCLCLALFFIFAIIVIL